MKPTQTAGSSRPETAPTASQKQLPDPRVTARASRRQYSTKYKLPPRALSAGENASNSWNFSTPSVSAAPDASSSGARPGRGLAGGLVRKLGPGGPPAPG